MWAFQQKPKAPQQNTSARVMMPGRAHFGQSSEVNSILHSQRTIGNLAVQRLLRAKSYGVEAASDATASVRLGHDFSRIPVHEEASVGIQSKLGANTFDDIYEHEADRISDQVMRMPEPHLHFPWPGGGGCSKCQTEQPDHEHERLQTKRVQASGKTQIAMPPIVQEVLAAPGQPLDPATRGFMEPRFGYDFSKVRVHSGGTAEQSAREVSAHAYTVGHDIVFGAGRSAPGTPEGRRLIAHELVHVVQQSGGNVTPSSLPSNRLRLLDLASSSVGSDVLQRSPDEPEQTGRELRLKELARDPQEAHLAWKKMSGEERLVVIAEMAQRFGGPFAQQFLEEANKGKPQLDDTFYGSGMGPTPDQLIARGYRQGAWFHTGAADINVEVWFHPSGRRIRRDVSRRTADTPQSEKPRVPPKPPIDPPRECAPLEEVTLGILKDTISAETYVQEDLKGEKGRLERMNKTADDYRPQYDEYIQSLQAMKDRSDAALNDIENLRKQLVDMNCPVSTIDGEIPELLNLQIWSDIESSPMSTQFLQPFNVHPKDRPDDEE